MIRPTWGGVGLREDFMEVMVTFELNLKRLCGSLGSSQVGRVFWVAECSRWAKAQRKKEARASGQPQAMQQG